MANPALGAKQICPTCSTKFYDLTRRPAVCPKCGSEFDPEEALRNRRVRARSAAPEEEADEEKTPVAAEPDGFEAEPEDAPELDVVVDEPPLLTDDDAEEEVSTPADPGVDFTTGDDLEEADDDAVPFIDDEDGDFADEEIDGLPDTVDPEDT